MILVRTYSLSLRSVTPKILELHWESERVLVESTGAKQDVARLSISAIHCGCDVNAAREKRYNEKWDKDSSLDVPGFGT